jgi:DNA-binding response OmpR family regulator
LKDIEKSKSPAESRSAASPERAGQTLVPAPAARPHGMQRITEVLSGKRFALIGFDHAEADRMVVTFERVRANALAISGDAGHPGLSPLARFDACVVNASAQADAQGRRPVEVLIHSDKPGLMVGSGQDPIDHALALASATHDFLGRPWQPEDLLFRAYRICRHAVAATDAEPGSRAAQTRIVVADDDLTTTMLMTAMLKNAQMSSEIAHDGAEALRLARELKPDLMLLDLQMPEMDGFEVLAALRNDPVTRSVAIIVLTASHAENDIARGFSLGADDFITKPFHPLEMMARVRRLVRSQRIGEGGVPSH